MNRADAFGVRSFCGLVKLTENNPNLSLQFTKYHSLSASILIIELH